MSEFAEESANGAPDILFSVIVVCLNAETHISEALGSVISQDHSSFELVVVDGGSTDGTQALIAGHQERYPELLRVVSERDEGLYDAMNKGLALARGEWVVYIGADDRMAPGALRTVADALEAAAGTFGRRGHPQIVCGATRVFGDGSAWEEPAQSFRGRSRVPKRAPSRHQSLYVTREALETIGGFDTTYRIAADYEAYLRLVAQGAEELLIPQVLSEFRLGGMSSTLRFRTAAEYRDIRVAHGANPLLQQLVMAKSLAAVTLAEALRRATGSKRAQT